MLFWKMNLHINVEYYNLYALYKSKQFVECFYLSSVNIQRKQEEHNPTIVFPIHSI